MGFFVFLVFLFWDVKCKDRDYSLHSVFSNDFIKSPHHSFMVTGINEYHFRIPRKVNTHICKSLIIIGITLEMMKLKHPFSPFQLSIMQTLYNIAAVKSSIGPLLFLMSFYFMCSGFGKSLFADNELSYSFV